MKTETYFAIVQDGYGILGVGETLADAVRDHNEYADEPISEDDSIEPYGSHTVDGNVYVAACSSELFHAVKERGGCVRYDFDCKTGLMSLSKEEA